MTDNISSQPRYDHFDTSPYLIALCNPHTTLILYHNSDKNARLFSKF